MTKAIVNSSHIGGLTEYGRQLLVDGSDFRAGLSHALYERCTSRYASPLAHAGMVGSGNRIGV